MKVSFIDPDASNTRTSTPLGSNPIAYGSSQTNESRRKLNLENTCIEKIQKTHTQLCYRMGPCKRLERFICVILR